MTLAYWPARLGESARLIPVGPWQIAQRCASVAPRPIEFWVGRASVVGVRTASENGCAGFGSLVDEAARNGRPAALQMASQRSA